MDARRPTITGLELPAATLIQTWPPARFQHNLAIAKRSVVGRGQTQRKRMRAGARKLVAAPVPADLKFANQTHRGAAANPPLLAAAEGSYPTSRFGFWGHVLVATERETRESERSGHEGV